MRAIHEVLFVIMVIVCLVVFSRAVRATETDFIFTKSHHVPDYDYNTYHPHIRVSHKRFIVGAFYNSYRKASVYAGMRYDYKRLWVEGGLTTGYAYTVVPMVRAGVTVNERFSLFASPFYDVDHEAVGGVIGVDVRLFGIGGK